MHIELIQSVYKNGNRQKISQDIELYALDNGVLRERSISESNSVIEDGWYGIRLYGIKNEYTGGIQLYLNDERIECDWVELSGNTDTERVLEAFFEQRKETQIFLMQYDVVCLGVHMKEEFCMSKYFLCLSSNVDDYNSIKSMIQTLIEFEDETICRWVFGKNTNINGTRVSLLQGGLVRDSYKSVESFHQMLNDIITIYKKNASIYRNHASNKYYYVEEKMPYEKIQRLGQTEFNWLAQNMEVLRETNFENGIRYGIKRYMPEYLKCKSSKKSADTYENRVVVGFLHMVIKKTRSIMEHFGKVIEEEKGIYNLLQKMEFEGKRAPILIIKEYQIKNADIALNKLRVDIELLKKIYMNYSQIITCEQIDLTTLPRKTKIFQEVLHYKEIYNIIIKWFQYGEMSLEKENLFFRIKTIDKIYEYFCLFKLLIMFRQHGYSKRESAEAISLYEYEMPKGYAYTELDVANTYEMTNGDNMVTIYYQPVIYSDSENKTNNIGLFRMDTHNNFYTPDFLIKYRMGSKVRYAILDSKFSKRRNLKKYNVLENLMVRYCVSLASKEGNIPSVNYLWLLQGRHDTDTDTAYYFGNSSLYRKYQPKVSYGIYTLNDFSNPMNDLWDELVRVNEMNLPS